MAGTHREPELADVRQLRHRQLLDRLDYLRALRRLAVVMTQSDLAKALGLTQPSISSALKSASKVPDRRSGFSGAGPYEIAQRHLTGELDHDQLVDELVRWGEHPVGGDRFGRAVDNHTDPGVEMRKAVRDGLLDEDTYRVILDRQEELSRRSAHQRSASAPARGDATDARALSES